MPELERPDGIRIHWERRGEGPVVSLVVHTYAQPEVLGDLLDDLARDHTVVVHDGRGSGRSTRSGPYDLPTEAADYAAVLEEAGGGPGVAIGWGEGSHPVMTVAVERPDLIATVIAMGGGGGMLRPGDAAQTEGLASSESVRDAMLEMVAKDYRGAVRHLITATNTELDEDQIRARVDRAVAYREHEAALTRMRSWIQFDVLGDVPERLGYRLWFVQWPTEWFTDEGLIGLRERLPESRITLLDPSHGPISSPGITAAIVREASAALR